MSIGSYDYEGLCEAFINQSKPEGKTAQGRLWFTNNRLYSYNSLLAELDIKNNTILIDKHIASYSITSRKHFNQLYDTVIRSKKFKIYNIYLDLTPIENLTVFMDFLNELLLRYKRARKNKPYIRERLIQEYHDIQKYIDYAHIDKRTKPYKQFKQFFNTMFKEKIL